MAACILIFLLSSHHTAESNVTLTLLSHSSLAPFHFCNMKDLISKKVINGQQMQIRALVMDMTKYWYWYVVRRKKGHVERRVLNKEVEDRKDKKRARPREHWGIRHCREIKMGIIDRKKKTVHGNVKSSKNEEWHKRIMTYKCCSSNWMCCALIKDTEQISERSYYTLFFA